jgi:hypothetical protein
MNWYKLLDKVEENLKKHGVDGETARSLCYVADSHEPWFTEAHSGHKFSNSDIKHLTEWLLEKKDEKGFI